MASTDTTTSDTSVPAHAEEEEQQQQQQQKQQEHAQIAEPPHPVIDNEVLDVKYAVQKTLESQGLLDNMRSLMRAAVYVALDQNKGEEDLRRLNANPAAQAFAKSPEGQVALEMVCELLEFLGLTQTLSVFKPEVSLLKYTGAKAGMEREEEAEGEVALAQKRRHRQEISAMMGLPKDNLSSSPVLVQLIKEAQKRRNRVDNEAQIETVLSGEISSPVVVSTRQAEGDLPDEVPNEAQAGFEDDDESAGFDDARERPVSANTETEEALQREAILHAGSDYEDNEESNEELDEYLGGDHADALSATASAEAGGED